MAGNLGRAEWGRTSRCNGSGRSAGHVTSFEEAKFRGRQEVPGGRAAPDKMKPDRLAPHAAHP